MTGPAGTTGSAVDGIDVDRVAAVVAACPGVARLTGGTSGAGTYLPGRRVPGVVVRQPAGAGTATIEVHVVGRYGLTMGELAGQVRAAVAALVPGGRVDVVVQDLDTGPVPPPAVTG